MDDFEVEVTDLRTGESGRTVVPPTRPRAEAEPEVVTEPLVRREHAAWAPMRVWRALRRDPRWRRLAGGVAAAVCVVVALVVVFAGSAPARALTGRFFPTATPVPPLAYAETHVVLTETVPWGILRIDGVDQPRNATLANAAPIVLLRGSHVIEYTAAPFPSVRCVLSAPPAKADTCPLNTSQQALTQFSSLRAVALGANVHKLPRGEVQLLVRETQRALRLYGTGASGMGATVRSGEHYLAVPGAVRQASAPFTAELDYGLGGSSSGLVGYNGEACDPFCTQFASPYTQVSGAWQLLAAAAITWRYTLPDGTSLQAPADDTPSTPAGQQSVTLLPLEVYWKQGWQVSALQLRQEPNAPICTLGMQAATRLLAQSPRLLDPRVSFGYRGLPATAPFHVLDGCLVIVGPAGYQGRPKPLYELLYRFGVLLAANYSTQQQLPKLPLPDAYERSLVAAMERQL